VFVRRRSDSRSDRPHESQSTAFTSFNNVQGTIRNSTDGVGSHQEQRSATLSKHNVTLLFGIVAELNKSVRYGDSDGSTFRLALQFSFET